MEEEKREKWRKKKEAKASGRRETQLDF